MMESPLMEEVVMSNELYKAAIGREFESVKNTLSVEELCRKTVGLNNMVHIAIRHCNFDFVRKAVDRCPDLLWEPNSDGNTPFHFAAEIGKKEIIMERDKFVKEVCDELTDLMRMRMRMKNSKGNTALHTAIIHSQIEVAIILLEKYPELATIVNESAEAPLHLAIKYFPDKNDEWSTKKRRDCLSHVKNKKTNLGKDENLRLDEEFVILIIALLEKASKVAGWRDGSGLTPLHKAASVNKAINLSLIECMIEVNPECMEVCDTSGKTILHHLVHRIEYLAEAKDFSNKTGVNCFVDHQDHDGNTAFHFTAKARDFIILELCSIYWSANPSIRNKKDKSVNHYLKKCGDGFNKYYHASSRTPKGEIHQRIELGDVSSIKKIKERIGSSLYEIKDFGRNVMHRLLNIESGWVIIPTEFISLMEDFVRAESLSKQRDNDGDTPAHILAHLRPHRKMIHLATGIRDNPTNEENLYPGLLKPSDPAFFDAPYTSYAFEWICLENTQFFKDLMRVCLSDFQIQGLVKNKKDNTALHEAILADSYPVFMHLAQQHDYKVATSVNRRKETVLHLLASRESTPPTTIDEAMVKIIESDLDVGHNFLDDDGLTPIMRAVKAGNLSFAKRLWDSSARCPKFIELKGHNNQTFWHMLAKLSTTSFDSTHSFFTEKDVCLQLLIKDEDENTALHLAIDCRNLDTAQFFLECYQKHDFSESLLDKRNKNGDMPGEMIGSLPYLPPEFEQFIWKDSKMIGSRSIWGIPTTQMEGYVNTMGVIAALLTTITFTAAFTVPGGLDQEKGTPLLIDDPAFQVFIISDVFAMCFSMMSLFCLLWIMATGDKSKSVVLLDFSIILLLASFYTTLVTFMTGLYATLHHVKYWIAIVSLVPCSMLVLLMHRYFVIKLIIPSGRIILVFFDKVCRSAKTAFLYVRDLLKPTPELPVRN